METKELVLSATTRPRRKREGCREGGPNAAESVSKDQHGSWWGGVPPLTPVYRRAVLIPGASGQGLPVVGGAVCSVSASTGQCQPPGPRIPFRDTNGRFCGSHWHVALGKRSRVQPAHRRQAQIQNGSLSIELDDDKLKIKKKNKRNEKRKGNEPKSDSWR